MFLTMLVFNIGCGLNFKGVFESNNKGLVLPELTILIASFLEFDHHLKRTIYPQS